MDIQLDPPDTDLAARHWTAYQNKLGTVAQGNMYANGKHTTVYAHRLVLSRVLRRPLRRNESVAFADGNPLNCRRANLSLVSASHVAGKRGMSTTNTSGYKGVTWNNQAHKWQAQIVVNGQYMGLGHYDDPADGARAYDAAAIEHFGPGAATNARLGLLPDTSAAT